MRLSQNLVGDLEGWTGLEQTINSITLFRDTINNI